MVRIYGKVLQTWTATDEAGRERLTQKEYFYRDYNEQGETIGTGSEDYSPERERETLLKGYLYTWDGEKLNKGGNRWFDCRGFYIIRKSDRRQFKELMKQEFSVDVVEFRTR